MTLTTADIRRFLVDTFGDEDLRTLCFDYFRDVYDDFTTGMTKGHMIQLLIERCVRRGALANLEAALRAERPDQYVKQFGAPIPPPMSSDIPAEIAPAGRDPRQVFVSHAHQDAEFAHKLAADLDSAGWCAWIAPESIQPGEKWVEAIGRGLDGSGVFVVALTAAAVASNWVRNETNAAIELDNRGEAQFIPLDVATCTVPTLWNIYQRVPFRGRYEDGAAALLRRLETSPAATRRHGDAATRREPPRIEIAPAALRLSGPQVQELMASLLDAYDEGSLRQMVRFQLDEHLDLITGGGNLSQVVFSLIAWAERTGRIAELIAKAQAYNPGNARLAAFARSVPGIAVVEPTRVAPQAPMPTRAAPAAGPITFDWVTIPAGDFLMGSDKQKDELAFDDEAPQHMLHLPEYRIARVPVTVAQFAAFVGATGHKTTAEAQGSAWSYTGSEWQDIKGADWAHPRGWASNVRSKQDHPVTCVSWHDALAFCKWAGVRLPTEAELEKAASWEQGSGGAGEPGRKRVYPWGDNAPTDKLCNFDMNVNDTTPVRRYPDGMSPYGLLDVTGNAREWTSSLWDKDTGKSEFGYPYDANDGRENPNAPDAVRRVVRGGSFWDHVRVMHCAFRDAEKPDFPDGGIGFRVVSPGS
jgi:formylglycine-generating enzyme required for sulfatase activity